jgi:RNA polymerase sigma-B factor
LIWLLEAIMSPQNAVRTPGPSRSNRGKDPYDNIEPWLAKMAALPVGDPERTALREQIVRRCMPLADHIARRYCGRGETYDDLYQVASLAVILAIDRFDPSVGSSFGAFAVPTILGEVRRHFRDHLWALRVPRGTKVLQARIGPAVERLAQRLHRMPTTAELAAELGVELLEITRAMLAANAYTADSIDGGTDACDRTATRAAAATMMADEAGYRRTEEALTVAPLLRELPEREREVLRLRFFENWPQSQIAERLGVSQMQISRILSRTLATLRARALGIDIGTSLAMAR